MVGEPLPDMAQSGPRRPLKASGPLLPGGIVRQEAAVLGDRGSGRQLHPEMRPHALTAQYVVKAADRLAAVDVTDFHPAFDRDAERQEYILRHAERPVEIIEPGQGLP